MINPEVQDAITSGIASVAGVPHEQTEAALQVLSGVAKLARSYYNPDGTLVETGVPQNQRKFLPHRGHGFHGQKDEGSWFPWAKGVWGGHAQQQQEQDCAPEQTHYRPQHGHGHSSHGADHSFEASHGGSAAVAGTAQGEGHKNAYGIHQASGLAGLGATHAQAAQLGHAAELAHSIRKEHATGFEKKGGVDMGFNYDLHFNRKKDNSAYHTREHAWGCAEQAASVFRKLSVFDVCGVFGSNKKEEAAHEFDHSAAFEEAAAGNHHWNAAHGHS